MGKQSEAKKKRRQKRLEFKKMEEKAYKNLDFLSKSFKIIDETLKETDKEFAEAYSIFENLKYKYLCQLIVEKVLVRLEKITPIC